MILHPGGHLKPDRVKDFISAGILFKPAHYILKLLYEADSMLDKFLGITKEEATHCIFNDLRVTRDNRNTKETLKLILSNRKAKIEYERGGDITRYAKDILDYMVHANLLIERHGYFYLNHSEMESVMFFINDKNYFKGYDCFYGKDFNVSQITKLESDWFNYVNAGLSSDLFKTDLTSYFEEENDEKDIYKVAVDSKISEILEGIGTTKDVGDLGENLIIGHEKMRLLSLGREDLIHLIKKLPTSLAVGYDIQSVEADSRKRYIEVKTTISNHPIRFLGFHLTKNEWATASTLTERYFVYRLMINRSAKIIYILQDPVRLYKQDKITMQLTDGAEINFSESVAEKTELLLWKN